MKHFLGCQLSMLFYIWEASFIVTPSCHIKMFTLSASQWPALAVGTLKTCSYLFLKKTEGNWGMTRKTFFTALGNLKKQVGCLWGICLHFYCCSLSFYSSFYSRLHSSELIQHSACFSQAVQSSSVLIAACISFSHFNQKSHNFNTLTASKTSRIQHIRVEWLFFIKFKQKIQDQFLGMNWLPWFSVWNVSGVY